MGLIYSLEALNIVELTKQSLMNKLIHTISENNNTYVWRLFTVKFVAVEPNCKIA